MSETDGENEKSGGLMRGSLFRNVFYLVVNGGSSALLGFVFILVASRYIPQAELGAGSTLVSLVSLVGFASGLGLNIGIIHFLPKAVDRNRLINACLTIVTVSSIIAGCAALVLLQFINIGDYVPTVGALTIVSVLFFAVSYNLGAFVNSVYISNKESRFVFYKDSILFSAIRLALLAVLLYLGFNGSWSIYLSWGFGLGISAIAGILVFLPFVEKGYRASAVVSAEELGATARFSFGNYLGGILGNAPALLFPILITQSLGTQQTAWFVIPWTVVSMLLMAVNALSTALFAEGASEPEKFRSRLVQATRFAFPILIPVVAVMVIFAREILWFFGQTYADDSLTILRLLLLSVPPMVVISFYATSEQVMGRVKGLLAIYAVSGGVPLAISAFTVGTYGIESIPIAWLISQLVCATVTGFVLLRRYRD
jgi:O-antigen/teichoic acid export membrane protein